MSTHQFDEVRPAAVAGTFYPADPGKLRRSLDNDLNRTSVDTSPATPKALVAPHAGYVYSGPIAGSAYRTLRPLRGTVRRVILLGPAHRAAVDGMVVPTVDAFETPLGPVTVDQRAQGTALEFPYVYPDDNAHSQEHSLEVHLPFLIRTLGGDIDVLPLVVGTIEPNQVADVLDALWGGPETLIVVSSDLSHYHDYETAVEKDRHTAEAILGKQVASIGPYDACGAFPLRGLLVAADRHGLDVSLLDLRNSGDTAGDRSRVVGYGAFSLGEAATTCGPR